MSDANIDIALEALDWIGKIDRGRTRHQREVAGHLAHQPGHIGSIPMRGEGIDRCGCTTRFGPSVQLFHTVTHDQFSGMDVGQRLGQPDLIGDPIHLHFAGEQALLANQCFAHGLRHARRHADQRRRDAPDGWPGERQPAHGNAKGLAARRRTHDDVHA